MEQNWADNKNNENKNNMSHIEHNIQSHLNSASQNDWMVFNSTIYNHT
jgi:hypothetical protein